MVECQLPKLDVVGSSPISRSIFQQLTGTRHFYRRQEDTRLKNAVTYGSWGPCYATLVPE